MKTRSTQPRQTTSPINADHPFAGLRFAVYARKSNEDARHEDHRSTARQVEQARRYVAAKGGEVLAEHLYTDDAVSGAEFKARAGLLRLLDALKNGKPFNALVMSEESRLGREQVETAYILKSITDAGVRVFYYLEDKEAKLDSAMAKIMSSLSMFSAEMERERARQRVRDSAERKARQGHVTGGQPFGYRNVRMKDGRPAGPGETHDFVVREIKDDEAAAIRGMFEAYRDGFGMTAIAKSLNADPAYMAQNRIYFGGQRVPTPRANTGSWGPAGVSETLVRPLYRGELVWGKTTHVDKGGRASIAVKADREPIRIAAPTLRIIDEPLWQAVQRRLKAAGEAYLRDEHGRLQGKPDRPDLRGEGGYLLSGLAKCGACSWNLVVVGGRDRRYGCGRHITRGGCANDLRQPVTLVDAAFLAELERTVMTPEHFAATVERTVAFLRERLRMDPDCRARLEKERAALQKKIARWVAAIGDGQAAAALVREIKEAERRIAEIDAELAGLEAAPALDLDRRRLEREVEGRLAHFADLLMGNVPRARQALKKILADRLTATPTEAGGARVYRFTGPLRYGPMLRYICTDSPPGSRFSFHRIDHSKRTNESVITRSGTPRMSSPGRQRGR